MSLIYSVVARGAVVLAEHTDSQGNFITVTHRILEKIPPTNDDQRSYLYDKYIFHYIVVSGLTYMCMADEAFGRRRPFAFLDNIKDRFEASYGSNAKTAMAYGMNSDFARVLQIQMNFYSKDPEADKITKVRGEIDEVKSVMVANIEKVLERGEKIELLVEQTDKLQHNAFEFKKGSTQLKRAMWWKNVKITIILVLVVLVVVYIAAALACGWRFQKCISKAKDFANTTTSLSSTLTSISSSSVTTATSDTTGTITITSASASGDGTGGMFGRG